jgi:hypothetical protein
VKNKRFVKSGDLYHFQSPPFSPLTKKDRDDVDAMESIEQIKELYLKVVCV